jgi:hypothetical protein
VILRQLAGGSSTDDGRRTGSRGGRWEGTVTQEEGGFNLTLIRDDRDATAETALNVFGLAVYRPRPHPIGRNVVLQPLRWQ